MPEKRKRGWCSCCCCGKKKTGDEEQVENHELYQFHQIKKVKKTADVVYTQDLTEPLRPGACIIIRGTVRTHCKRFAINLLNSRGPKSDIVFHFNPRLALRYIVRNSYINNSWGEEEITSADKFNLDRNKMFELQIVASVCEFLVALDGRHVCAYVYRSPLDKINKIQVDGIEVEGIEICKQIKTYPSVEGAIDVANVDYKQVDAYPVISAEIAPFTVPMGSSSDEERLENKELIVPLTAMLPEGFKTGWQLEIAGRVKVLPSAFYINLQMGNTLWPHPMIPLHLNPRFYTTYGNHLFVRNSWIDGKWGSEERTAGFQFAPGKKFHLAIRMNPENFAVWVDGCLAGEFRFRTPVDVIDTLYIHGDVQIHDVYLKDHIDDKYFSKSKENIDNSL